MAGEKSGVLCQSASTWMAVALVWFNLQVEPVLFVPEKTPWLSSFFLSASNQASNDLRRDSGPVLTYYV